MHKHHHCNHLVSYCQQCDVAYCTKCSRSWGTGYVSPYWANPYLTTTTTTGGTTTGNITFGEASTFNTSAHDHGGIND